MQAGAGALAAVAVQGQGERGKEQDLEGAQALLEEAGYSDLKLTMRYQPRIAEPVWIASQVVANLQAVVARNTDAHEALILSVTRFNAGAAFNVIPDSAELAGSVRCYAPQVRERVPALIERIAERYRLDLQLVNAEVDPTFRFMSLDWDGRVRMDPSSSFAMHSLIAVDADHHQRQARPERNEI